MQPESGYPVSLVLEGPVFRDELKRSPVALIEGNRADSLRIVPAKSAASGVCSIYFRPEHRNWALVRLAKRYRWVFEVQLNRGMSGKQQLLRQGFTPDDMEFLYDIVPAPPTKYNPIVYDMLWLIATYEEYMILTKAINERRTFTPKELLRSIPDIDQSDTGFFTRFLRSHLIEPVSNEPRTRHGPSRMSTIERQIDMEKRYEVTSDGVSALEGIIAEHERIFEKRDFAPLLINSDPDPRQHLKEFEPAPDETVLDLDIDELQEDDDGVLGEIAASFSSMVDSNEGDTERSTSR